MTSDYSIIIQVRQRFGDEQDSNENQLETSAPFVGSSKQFPFVCENIDRSQVAVLQFQSLGITHRRNIIRINNFDLFGGLPTSVDRVFLGQSTQAFNLQVWNSNTLLVPSFVLRTDNILRIEARNAQGGTSGNVDNFILDNMVILFKKRSSFFGNIPLNTAMIGRV